LHRAFAQSIGGCVRRTDLAIAEIQHAAAAPECQPDTAMVRDHGRRLLMTPHHRPLEILDQTPIPHVQQALVGRKPETTRPVPRYGKHFVAGHAGYAYKTV